MSGSMLWVELARAVDHGQSEHVALLLRDGKCRLGMKTEVSWPKFVMCRLGHPCASDSKCLMQMGSTVLHRAAKAGHADIVQMLVDAGADPSASSVSPSPNSSYLHRFCT